jgi:hypothetical protein
MDTNTILMIFLIILLLIILLKINVTIVDTQTVPIPVPAPIKPIGGCAGTRYGCCPNGVTARINPAGTNC